VLLLALYSTVYFPASILRAHLIFCKLDYKMREENQKERGELVFKNGISVKPAKLQLFTMLIKF